MCKKQGILISRENKINFDPNIPEMMTAHHLYRYQTPALPLGPLSSRGAVIPLLSNPIIPPSTPRLIKLLILSWCLIL